MRLRSSPFGAVKYEPYMPIGCSNSCCGLPVHCSSAGGVNSYCVSISVALTVFYNYAFPCNWRSDKINGYRGSSTLVDNNNCISLLHCVCGGDRNGHHRNTFIDKHGPFSVKRRQLSIVLELSVQGSAYSS